MGVSDVQYKYADNWRYPLQSIFNRNSCGGVCITWTHIHIWFASIFKKYMDKFYPTAGCSPQAAALAQGYFCWVFQWAVPPSDLHCYTMGSPLLYMEICSVLVPMSYRRTACSSMGHFSGRRELPLHTWSTSYPPPALTWVAALSSLLSADLNIFFLILS